MMRRPCACGVGGLLVIALLMGALGCGALNHAGEVKRLRSLFPVLEKHQITGFNNQDWCRAIEFSGGAFATTTRPTGIYMLNSPPASFTPAAEAVFAEVVLAIQRSGSACSGLKFLRYEKGRLVAGVFNCSADFSRHHYYYAPGYTLPADLPRELEYQAIDPDWYYEWEDWN